MKGFLKNNKLIIILMLTGFIVLSCFSVFIAKDFKAKHDVSSVINSPINPNPDVWEDSGGGSGTIFWNDHTYYEPLDECDCGYGVAMSGTGKKSDPYLIHNLDHLSSFVEKTRVAPIHRDGEEWTEDGINYVDSTIYGKLMHDIEISSVQDFSEENISSLNSGHEMISFCLDGNYHEIQVNFSTTVSDDGYEHGVGLFGRVNTCSLYNLKVAGKIIAMGDVQAVGGLFGSASGNIYLNNCYVSTTVSVYTYNYDYKNYYIGGIAGYLGNLQMGGYGSIYLKDSCFAGSVYDQSKGNACNYGALYATYDNHGSHNLENSYYKCQLYRASSSSYLESNPTMDSMKKSFNVAYSEYNTSTKYNFVEGDWASSCKYIYYYSGCPNISWLINRNKISLKSLNVYTKRYEDSSATFANRIGYAVDPNVTVSATSVTYSNFGIEIKTTPSYATPTNYTYRTCTTETTTNEIKLIIIFDRNVNIVILNPVNESGTAVSTNYYTLNSSGTATPSFADLIGYSIASSVSTATFTIANSQTYTLTTNNTDPRYEFVGWKVDSYEGSLITTSGTFSSYKNSMVLENGSWVIKIQPILKLKEYGSEFN